MSIHYKIRHKETGLFSKGGSRVDWSKAGKTWTTIGALKNHLNMFIGHYHSSGIPDTWEIVEFEMVQRSAKPATEYVSQERLLKHFRTVCRDD